MNPKLASRFRGYYPVIIDVETAGFDPKKNALLEIAAVLLDLDEQDQLVPAATVHAHVEPFPNSILDPAALAFTGIDPTHPFRFALPEREALEKIFHAVRPAQKQAGCTRSVLVGHNSWFDLSFLNAAIERCRIKRAPFHPFTSFDTATLGGLAYGQTVLAKACKAAAIPFDGDQAHSAIYDAERTAELFCGIVNRWTAALGWPAPLASGETDETSE